MVEEKSLVRADACDRQRREPVARVGAAASVTTLATPATLE
jgi:hypothetical protein